jgi:hypothetical protein
VGPLRNQGDESGDMNPEIIITLSARAYRQLVSGPAVRTSNVVQLGKASAA